MFQFATENGCKTIVTKDIRYQYKIGTAKRLSFNDIKEANFMYNCNGKDTIVSRLIVFCLFFSNKQIII